MTHRTEHPELTRIAAEIARATRPAVCRESIAQAWERVAELRAAGLDFEANTVEAQAREMEQTNADL
jgi:hypothetical protein